MEISSIFALAVGAIGMIMAIAMFNAMVGRKNQVEYALSSIEAQLKKRFDLIPNLVAVAEKYLKYESGVLEELTRCRAKVVSGNLEESELMQIDAQVGKTIGRLFAVAENYPQLRASEPFLHLQASLNEVEEQLAASRRAFNAAVTDFNNGCEMFPLNIVARMMGYMTKQWFQIPEEERQPVKVWR